MANYDRRLIMPDNCSWCGHLPHDTDCDGTIVTGSGKNTSETACPCIQHTNHKENS